MSYLATHFYCEEDGAVTVDWVVLTAVIIMLAAVVSATVVQGVLYQSSNIGVHLTKQNIPTFN
jgi:Flp pilus assembly pilin Flp